MGGGIGNEPIFALYLAGKEAVARGEQPGFDKLGAEAARSVSDSEGDKPKEGESPKQRRDLKPCRNFAKMGTAPWVRGADCHMQRVRYRGSCEQCRRYANGRLTG